MAPTEGIAPLEVRFKLGGKTLPFVATHVELRYGDGARARNTLLTTLKHTYERPGTYRVSLLIRGDHDNFARARALVRVLERPELRLRVRPRIGAAPLRVDVATGVSRDALAPEIRLGDRVLARETGQISVVLREPGEHTIRLVAKSRTGDVLEEKAVVHVSRHELSGLYNHNGGVVEIVEQGGRFRGRFLVTTPTQAKAGYSAGDEIVRGEFFHRAHYSEELIERGEDGLPASPLFLGGAQQFSRGLYLLRHSPDCPVQMCEYRFTIDFDTRPPAEGHARAAHRISGLVHHAPWMKRYERAHENLGWPVPRPGIVGKIEWVRLMMERMGAAGEEGDMNDCVVGTERNKVTPAELTKIDRQQAETLVDAIRSQLDRVQQELLDMATGEFFLSERDMGLPGRGLHWEFVRTYRSHNQQGTSLGHGWTHNAMFALVRRGDDFAVRSSRGGWITFTKQGPTLYAARSGLRLLIKDDKRIVRDVDGTLYHFEPLARDPKRSRITAVEDASGHSLHYETDTFGRVRQATDTFGRVARYRYGQFGLLVEVEARLLPRPGSTLPAIVYRFRYEPLYHKLKSIHGPFRDRVPDDSAALQRALLVRYDYEEADKLPAHLAAFGRTVRPAGLGDVNADGRTDQTAGHCVRISKPAEVAADGSWRGDRDRQPAGTSHSLDAPPPGSAIPAATGLADGRESLASRGGRSE